MVEQRVPVKIGNQQGRLGGGSVSWKGIEFGDDREEIPHLGWVSSEEDPSAGVDSQQRAGGRHSTAGEKLCQHLSLFCWHLQQHLCNNVIRARAEEKLVLSTWLYALIRAEAEERRVFFFRILHINEVGIGIGIGIQTEAVICTS